MNNTVATYSNNWLSSLNNSPLAHLPYASFLCSAKPLHKQCLQFLLGQLQYPGEMKNKA